MEIVAGPLDWTSIDEEQWSKFLDTETGKRLIPKLLEEIPSLLDKGKTNTLLIRSGAVLGFQQAAQRLLFLAHPPVPVQAPSVQAYPSLEDDSAWKDGQVLDAPKPT